MRSAAYNERAAITAGRTGKVFYFKHRDAPEHHDVLLPEGAGATAATEVRNESFVSIVVARGLNRCLP